jgi:Protein of unknown function, DUF547
MSRAGPKVTLINQTFLNSIMLLFLFYPGDAAAVPDPIAWNFWNVQGEVQEVDHGPWQHFLDLYLVASPDGINRVRYLAVTREDRAALSAYVKTQAALDPRKLTGAAQQAYWINLYNALTVLVVLEYPRKRSILRMGRKLLSIGPWDDEVVQIQGEHLTLNDIEHRILRPLYRDERVHFVVNCASIGCPNLATRAYTAATLDAMLEQQMHDYLAHARGLRFEDGKLITSSIFDWYRVDFGSEEPAVRAWLAKRQESLAKLLLDPEIDLEYDYDWGLNQSR